MEHQPAKKRNLLVRLLLFLLALAVALGAVGLVVFRDSLNMDALKRWFSYRALTLSDSGQAESFRYSGSVDDVFAALEGDLLVCSSGSISLYSGSGTEYLDLSVSMSAPAVDVSGDTAVVYDAGGTALYVFRQRAEVFSLTCDGSLLSAHLNADRMMTVVSQESGSRGVVTVYDGEGAVRAVLRLSSTYVMDAALADDGTTLAVVTIGQQSGSFSSSLLIYDLASVPAGDVSYDVSPVSSTDLGGSVILSLRQNGGIFWALGDRGVCVLGADGVLLGAADWSDQYLKSYSLAGDGFAVAQLGRYRAGSQGELWVVDQSGVLAGSLPLEEQVLSVDAAGRYFAVLTADRLDIYTSDLTLYSTLEGTMGARKVLLRGDGSALLISADSARLYVPS